jgi:hypothetical protein
MDTVEGLVGSRVKQFSVFMANKAGRLLDLVSMFSSNNIHVVALTILDNFDSAIARIVVDDPDKAKLIFEEHAVSFSVCNLIVVELPNSADDLRPVLTALLQGECNIHFVYAFLTRPRGKSVLALHVEDEEVAANVLVQNDFKLLSQDDITR